MSSGQIGTDTHNGLEYQGSQRPEAQQTLPDGHACNLVTRADAALPIPNHADFTPAFALCFPGEQLQDGETYG